MKKYILKLYNTLTLKEEEILPFDKKIIRLYTCGPTIYNFAHIGNFRTYVFEDILKRTLLFFGYKVEHVMNLTDIDDKTIRGAIENKKPLKEFTDPFKEAFFEDIEKLNIEKANHYPEATAYVPDMIKIIEKLLERGYAYIGQDRSIYFSIKKFPAYGRLSHLVLDELKVGASERVFHDEYDKENAADFVLWKSYDEKKDGHVFWESPFGKGRPGWHIECSAMSLKLLKDHIDIHCGGVDNIFPHHENEIAQSEAFNGKTFVLHWAHSEHLIVDGKKMSKSLKNFYTLRDLLNKGYSGKEIRYLLMHVHYRSKLNFTLAGLESAKSALKRIFDFIDRLKIVQSAKGQIDIDAANNKFLDNFSASLAQDLNISQALGHLFDFIRDINTLLDESRLSSQDASKIINALKEIDKVLGCLPLEEKKLDLPHDIQEALNKRQIARQEKNYKLADEKRKYIEEKGYIIEDLQTGQHLKKKQ